MNEIQERIETLGEMSPEDWRSEELDRLTDELNEQQRDLIGRRGHELSEE